MGQAWKDRLPSREASIALLGTGLRAVDAILTLRELCFTVPSSAGSPTASDRGVAVLEALDHGARCHGGGFVERGESAADLPPRPCGG